MAIYSPTTDCDHVWRNAVRDFIAERPVEDYACDHGDLGYGFGAWSREFLRAIGRRGWIGLTWPLELGGSGRPAHELYVLFSELAYAHAPAEALFYSLAVGQCIVSYGQATLKERVIPELLRGERACCEALSEHDAGSDLFSLRTSADRVSGGWRLTGRKVWISNGHLADYALVVARTDPQLQRYQGLAAFVVDLGQPGITRQPIMDVVNELSYSEIAFEDVFVPDECRLGEEETGIQQVLVALEWDRLWGRCGKAAYLRRDLHDLAEWCKATSIGGEPLWERDHVRDAIAASAVEIEVCDAVFEEVVSATISNSDDDMSPRVSLAKVFADSVGQRFYNRALEIVGIPGSFNEGVESLQERFLKLSLCAHGVLCAGGTPEIQQNVVANRYLKLSR
jgi:alkylation response protein AidB-like acyl-CoA dehydrogenase